MVSAQTLQGHWNSIKGEIKQRWGSLGNDDLTSFDGDIDKLVGVIQRKTGESRENIERFLDDVSSESASAVENISNSARQYAGDAGEAIREGYQQVAGHLQHGYSRAERAVQRDPARSVGMAFGAGLVAGVVVGLILRSR